MPNPSPRSADESPDGSPPHDSSSSNLRTGRRGRTPPRTSGRGFIVRRTIAIVSAAVVLGAVGLAVGPVVGTWLTHDDAIPEASFVGFIWGGRIGSVLGIASGIGIGFLISRRRDAVGP